MLGTIGIAIKSYIIIRLHWNSHCIRACIWLTLNVRPFWYAGQVTCCFEVFGFLSINYVYKFTHSILWDDSFFAIHKSKKSERRSICKSFRPNASLLHKCLNIIVEIVEKHFQSSLWSISRPPLKPLKSSSITRYESI